MTEGIITTLISSGVVLFGSVISIIVSAKNTRAKLRQDFEIHKVEIKGEMDLTKREIAILSDRVEAHNKVVERVYSLERDVAVLKAKEENQ